VSPSAPALAFAGLGAAAVALGLIVLVLARIDPPANATASPAGIEAHHADGATPAVVQGLALHSGAAVATLAAQVTPATNRTTIQSITIPGTPAVLAATPYPR
jgi:hypothetical protein